MPEKRVSTVSESAALLLLRTKERLQISTAVCEQTLESLRRSQEAVVQSRQRMQQSSLERLPSRTVETDQPSKLPPTPRTNVESFMQVVANRTISDEVVEMDGKHFVDCILVDCVLEYSGHPVVLETTEFRGCRFRFKGEAALTLRFCECFQLTRDSGHDYDVVSSPILKDQRPN